MNISNHTNQPSLQFIDLINKSVKKDIWNELDSGLWKLFDINAYLSNDMLMPSQKHLQKKLFPNYYQVTPGVLFESDSNSFKLNLYNPCYIKPSYDKVLAIASDFSDSLNAKKIGVHLSGGLDSSIIIGLLHALNIPFTPIGLKSDTFEFRTERHIQEKLISWGSDGDLISIDKCPYYSKILDIPMHQIPCGVFKSYASTLEMVKLFSQKGCDVVLSGQGGDSLFVESVQKFNKVTFNIGDEFMNDDFDELVYAPYGIKLISFYSHKPFIDLITSARIGQSFDPLKKWVRGWLKELLIPELSDFTYCADFLGITMKGLCEARMDIIKLFEEAYDLTRNSFFSTSFAKKFLEKDVYNFGYKDYIQYCSLISIMVWLHSFTNRNLPKKL